MAMMYNSTVAMVSGIKKAFVFMLCKYQRFLITSRMTKYTAKTTPRRESTKVIMGVLKPK